MPFCLQLLQSKNLLSKEQFLPEEYEKASEEYFFMDNSLPIILRSSNLCDRILWEFYMNHKWISLFLCNPFYGQVFSRVHHFLSLLSTIIFVVFLETIIYRFVGNQKICENISSSHCIDFSGMCHVRDGACVHSDSDDMFVFMVGIAFIIALVNIPISVTIDFIFRCVLDSNKFDEYPSSSESVGSGDSIITPPSLTTIASTTSFTSPNHIKRNKTRNLSNSFDISFRDKHNVVFYNILEDCKKRSTSIDNLSMIGTTSNSLVHNKQSQEKFAQLYQATNHRVAAEIRRLDALGLNIVVKRHRMMYLYYRDIFLLLYSNCPCSHSVIEMKDQRDHRMKVDSISVTSKIMLWHLLLLIDSVMLIYIAFFINGTTTYTTHLIYGTFVIWFTLDFVFISTITTFIVHIILPLSVYYMSNYCKIVLCHEVTHTRNDDIERSYSLNCDSNVSAMVNYFDYRNVMMLSKNVIDKCLEREVEQMNIKFISDFEPDKISRIDSISQISLRYANDEKSNKCLINEIKRMNNNIILTKIIGSILCYNICIQDIIFQVLITCCVCGFWILDAILFQVSTLYGCALLLVIVILIMLCLCIARGYNRIQKNTNVVHPLTLQIPASQPPPLPMNSTNNISSVEKDKIQTKCHELTVDSSPSINFVEKISPPSPASPLSFGNDDDFNRRNCNEEQKHDRFKDDIIDSVNSKIDIVGNTSAIEKCALQGICTDNEIEKSLIEMEYLLNSSPLKKNIHTSDP